MHLKVDYSAAKKVALSVEKKVAMTAGKMALKKAAWTETKKVELLVVTLMPWRGPQMDSLEDLMVEHLVVVSVELWVDESGKMKVGKMEQRTDRSLVDDSVCSMVDVTVGHSGNVKENVLAVGMAASMDEM